MRLVHLLRGCVAAGADGPHRLVRQDEGSDLLAGQPVEPLLDLPVEHDQRHTTVALLQRLSDAHDRCQLRPERGKQLPVHRLVSLLKQPAALAVADDHELRSGLLDHWRADFPGERPLAFPVQVLRRNADRTAARCFRRRMQRRERRGDDDLDVRDVLDDPPELLDEHDRLVDGLVHLPVRRDERSAHKEGASADVPVPVPRARCSVPMPPRPVVYVRRGIRARPRRRSRCG